MYENITFILNLIVDWKIIWKYPLIFYDDVCVCLVIIYLLVIIPFTFNDILVSTEESMKPWKNRRPLHVVVDILAKNCRVHLQWSNSPYYTRVGAVIWLCIWRPWLNLNVIQEL